MRAVGIKELKNKLSEYVRIAASGEAVLVTDRGRVVAELTAPEPGRDAAPADAKWADLIRRGLVRPATHATHEPPPKPTPVMTRAQLLKELARDREDR
ncbi:MAG TPA: type II toxin-antitoxin system prevent-host-death family antitoxin [Stellaceae bacterium]|jgi:antitoxin (DNA-binding transcriptional repressor) of toxin-antitoxin stability system|nr:type II toxin-antitoxin system prevent-host-death family antitoxin [Stellaceae bacterium]